MSENDPTIVKPLPNATVKLFDVTTIGVIFTNVRPTNISENTTEFVRVGAHVSELFLESL